MLFATGPQSIGYIEGAESEGMEAMSVYPESGIPGPGGAHRHTSGDVAWFKGSRSMELEKALDCFYAATRRGTLTRRRDFDL
jgi:hypothetical protein